MFLSNKYVEVEEKNNKIEDRRSLSPISFTGSVKDSKGKSTNDLCTEIDVLETDPNTVQVLLKPSSLQVCNNSNEKSSSGVTIQMIEEKGISVNEKLDIDKQVSPLKCDKDFSQHAQMRINASVDSVLVVNIANQNKTKKKVQIEGRSTSYNMFEQLTSSPSGVSFFIVLV